MKEVELEGIIGSYEKSQANVINWNIEETLEDLGCQKNSSINSLGSDLEGEEENIEVKIIKQSKCCRLEMSNQISAQIKASTRSIGYYLLAAGGLCCCGFIILGTLLVGFGSSQVTPIQPLLLSDVPSYTPS